MSQDSSNPLGIQAPMIVPQEASQAFTLAEVIVTCILGPGRGVGRPCTLIVSAEPPPDIPYRNLAFPPSSAACSLTEVPQVVEDLLKQQEGAFGQAWVKAWTEEQSRKSKSRRTRSSATPVAAGKPSTLVEEPTSLDGEDDDLLQEDADQEVPADEGGNDTDAVHESDGAEEEEEDRPDAAGAAPGPDAKTEAAEPALEKAVPQPGLMPLLGGVDL
jgi:hypothetical protein